MRAARDVLLVQIAGSRVVSGPRTTDKPVELAGPASLAIPLHLARVRAEVLLSLRGGRTGTVGFYTWVWASGKHGGPRLFSVDPGSCKLVLLVPDGPFLRSVGDYPAYDLPIPCGLTSAFIAAWKATKNPDSDFWQSLLETYLSTELRSLPSFNRNYWPAEAVDLAGLAGTLELAKFLDTYCVRPGPVHGRFAACTATARQFPGRCEAYRIAHHLAPDTSEGRRAGQSASECRARSRTLLTDSTKDWPLRPFAPPWQETQEQRRMRLRVYASALDSEVKSHVCRQVAEAMDLPECL